MENENLKIKNIKEIVGRFSSLLTAGKVESENHVRKLVIDKILENVWLFSYGFDEPGTYQEETDVQVGHSTVVHPDYELCCSGGKKVIIEAKSTSEDLDKWVEQLNGYVSLTNASAGILMNGREFRLYLTEHVGTMDLEPFRTVNMDNASDEDFSFILGIFATGYSFNDGQMKRDAAKKRSERDARERQDKFTDKWYEKLRNPSDDDLKCVIREIEGCSAVSQQKTDFYRTNVLPGAMSKIRDRIVNDAVKEHVQRENVKNHLEPEELAIGTLLEWFIEQKNGNVEFMDDESDAGLSVVFRSDCKKKILWIVGSVDKENGYTFTGVSFPNRGKGKGKVVKIDKPIDILRKYGDLVLWVYENINDPQSWSAGYDSKFSSIQ
jgi:hypothetical protein